MMDENIPFFSTKNPNVTNLQQFSTYVKNIFEKMNNAEISFAGIRFSYYTFVNKYLLPKINESIRGIKDEGAAFWTKIGKQKPRKFALKTFCFTFLGSEGGKIYAELRTISRVFARLPELIDTEKRAIIELLACKKFRGIPNSVEHYYRRKNIVDMEKIIGNVDEYKSFILYCIGINENNVEFIPEPQEPYDEDNYLDWRAYLYNVIQEQLFILPPSLPIRYLDQFVKDLRKDHRSWHNLFENNRDAPIAYQTKKLVYIAPPRQVPPPRAAQPPRQAPPQRQAPPPRAAQPPRPVPIPPLAARPQIPRQAPAQRPAPPPRPAQPPRPAPIPPQPAHKPQFQFARAPRFGFRSRINLVKQQTQPPSVSPAADANDLLPQPSSVSPAADANDLLPSMPPRQPGRIDVSMSMPSVGGLLTAQDPLPSDYEFED
jgi:hypothetical protein